MNVRKSQSAAPGLWAVAIAAVAVLPVVFVPVAQVADFFYLPKLLVLLALEAALAGLLFLQRLKRRDGASLDLGRPPGNPLALPVLAYWAVLAVATWRSVDPLRSLVGEPFRWEGLLTFLLYGGLVLLLPAVARLDRGAVAQRVDLLLRWGLAVAAVIVAYGVLQRYGLDPLPRDPVRSGAAWWHTAAFATLGNSNFFGSFCAVYLTLAASRYLAGEGSADFGQGWFWLAGSGVAYYGMLTSLSRGSWLAAGLALGLIFAAMLIARRPPALRRLAAVVLCLAFLTLLWRLADPLASPRVAALIQDTSAQSGTVGQRLWIWQGTWRAILASPWLGYGPDTLGQVFPRFEVPGRAAAGLAGWSIDRAHNDFLQVAVSSGLLGLAAYLWLLLRAGRAAWRLVAGEAADPLQRELAWSLAGGAMAHLAAMGTNLSTVSESPPFWGFLGLIAALAIAVPARTAWRARVR